MMVAFMLALAALTATAGRVDDDVRVDKDVRNVEASKPKKKQKQKAELAQGHDEEEDQAEVADAIPGGDDSEVSAEQQEASVSKIMNEDDLVKSKQAKDARELLSKAALQQAEALAQEEANEQAARDRGVEAARAHAYHEKIEAAFNKAVKDAKDTAQAEAPARANAEDAEKAEKKVSEEWTAADSLKEDTLHERAKAEEVAKRLNKVTAKDKEIHDAAQVKAQEKAALAATAFQEEAAAKAALDEATKNKQAAYAIVREKALQDNQYMKEVSRTQRVAREETTKLNNIRANLQSAKSSEATRDTEAQQAKDSAEEAAEYALAGNQVNLQAQQTASDVEDEASSDRALAANVDKYKMITDQVMGAAIPTI
jgi:hypothetical protein